MNKTDTSKKRYTARLVNLEYKKWKSVLGVQRPYQQNLLRLEPGKTLDIGCGIGRYLKVLPEGSVGIDHNPHSVDMVNKMGCVAFKTGDFGRSKYYKKASFDSLLLSHVLEHMKPDEGIQLIKTYLPLLKKNGQIIIFCPQERGYRSDPTHITFLDDKALNKILVRSGLRTVKSQSFPFPRSVGKYFIYNEFVVVGKKVSLSDEW